MTSPTNARPGLVPIERLRLEFPRSLAVYDTYTEAQRAVDYLSDHEFPVQNLMIVGTDLKQVERVTGRLTWGKVLAGGILSGMWLGLFVGLILSLFETTFIGTTVLSAVVAGAFFGLVWVGIGYAFTRGRRDFTSVSQVVATRYEVLVEHRAHEQARQMLSEMPGGAPLSTPSAAAPDSARPNPYEGRYGQKATVDEGEGGASALRPHHDTGASRPNPYEGRYGEKLAPDAERSDNERVDPGAAPPEPRG